MNIYKLPTTDMGKKDNIKLDPTLQIGTLI